MTGSASPEAHDVVPGRPKGNLVARLLPWLITAACFGYLYTRIAAVAARSDQGVVPYLLEIFAGVSWTSWLALMIPYSFFFFLIDSGVVWRTVNWFNTRVPYTDILPVRASAYILSILNEQVGKGAMAVYLNRRNEVPGWQIGSSMLFIMVCELVYLLGWASFGTLWRGDNLPEVFGVIPWVALAALPIFVLFLLYSSGRILPHSALRERHLFHAFKQARWWHYLVIIVMRSPALLAAVVVYTLALRLFSVEVAFADMLAYLPVIFFGAATPGPMRSVAITLWVTLFPEHPGQMAAFGLVQHNFFIFFNAAIGLLFLRRANREIFGEQPARA